MDTLHPQPNTDVDVAVIGTGYVGVTTAVGLASLGNLVIGIDIDADKIRSLSNAELPFHEPGLDDLLAEQMETGRLQFTTESESAARASVIMLCLPTPPGSDGAPDLGFVRAAVRSLAPHLAPGTAIVTKSTVPVGTHELVAAWAGSRNDLHVVSNPEFLREGTALEDFRRPDRIVIGAEDPIAAKRVAALYDGIEAPIQITDATSAELIKYAANTLLATKLGFINEMARLCDRVGGDIDAIAEGIGADHRIGPAFLRPGPGWGGSCFPKDTVGLAHVARRSGVRMSITEAASASNHEQLEHVIGRIEEMLGRPVHESTIAVWGLAFKAGTDDTRSSPAIEIVERLRGRLATVRAYDPVATTPGIDQTEDRYAVCAGADLLVVATEWPEFGDVDFVRLADTMRSPVVFDLRAVVPDETGPVVVHRLGRRPRVG